MGKKMSSAEDKESQQDEIVALGQAGSVEEHVHVLPLDDAEELDALIDKAAAKAAGTTIHPQQAFRTRMSALIADLEHGKEVAAISHYRIVGMAKGGGFFALSNGRSIPFNVVFDLGIAPRVEDMQPTELSFFKRMTKK